MGRIVLEEVHKAFGQVDVVHDLSFVVEAGEFVTLLGPSGCGKSTTLNLVAGLEDLNSGTITIDGKRVDSLPPDKRDLAFVFQDYALYPHKTVYENMAFGLRMRKTPKPEIETRIRSAAERLDIAHLLDRKPRALSGGQRQRVALGRAIVRRPSVFLFDEPLSNLDALLRDQTRSEIKRLHLELGATSVYVTHDQEEALSLSDRIAVLNGGRLEQYGSPEEIYRRPATEFVAGFVGKPRMNLFDAERLDGRRVRVAGALVLEAPDSVPEQVRVGLRPEELVLRPASEGGVRVTVQLVEPMGAATDVTVAVGDTSLVVRSSGFGRVGVGDELSLDASGAIVHVFDASTGVRRG
jgi:ABC-type sugar transport system ATPase subunit